ncbi:MAG: hypothetical protein ABFR89_06580 [Actinomycetota bacterium]
MNFVIAIVAAGVIGFVGTRLMGMKVGMIFSVAVGLIGGLIGSGLQALLKLPGGNIVWGIIGAIVLVFIVRLIPKKLLVKWGAKAK